MVVDFNKYINRREEYKMFEQMIETLENNPASGYTIKEAEILADTILKEAQVYDRVAPTPIVSISKKMGIEPFIENMKDDNSPGSIYINGTTEDIYGINKVIVVKKGEELYHQRFIIAHELGHFLLDYLGNPLYKNKNKLFTEDYHNNNNNSHSERRADRFAAELLMPSGIFLKEYIKANERSNYNRFYVVAFLSNLFETKESSIIRRIEEVTMEI